MAQYPSVVLLFTCICLIKYANSQRPDSPHHYGLQGYRGYANNQNQDWRLQQLQQQQQQQQQQKPHMSSQEKANVVNSLKKSDSDEKIQQIFNVSSEPGLRLYNNTFNPLFLHEPFLEELLDYQPQVLIKFNISSPLLEAGPSTRSTNIRTSCKFITEHESHRRGPFDVDPSACVLEQGKTFCTKVRNYPDLSSLNNILKTQFPDLVNYISEDALMPPNISQRMNIEPDEEFLCRSKETVLYPQAGENKEAGWSFIVNNEHFKQGVKVEECEEKEAKCNPLMSLSSGYYSTCKQNYIFRTLVAIKPDGKVFNDQFKLPSCCKCVIRPKKN